MRRLGISRTRTSFKLTHTPLLRNREQQGRDLPANAAS